MKGNWKIVKTNDVNKDQCLLGFFNTEQHAKDNIPYLWRKYGGNWIRSLDELVIKPVNPEEIKSPVCTDYMHYVNALIPKEDWKRVMNSDASAEIGTDALMCGGATYYYLSRMISKEWTVIDIGASYGAQSYLFQGHKQYIAVEPSPDDFRDYHIERFVAEGTVRYNMTAKTFIDKIMPTLDLDLDRTFAICNYVPNWYDENPSEIVRQAFKNLYVFYPA